MKIYDISLTISPELPTWPGDPGVNLERISKMEDGADANVTHMSLGVHTGTHVDAPFHFMGGESDTVETLALDILTGPAHVIYLPDVAVDITVDDLQTADIPDGTTRLLLKTNNSDWWAAGNNTFQEDFLALDVEAAEWLVQRGVKLVGVDYLSVAPFRAGVPTHRVLLGAGVIALEGLDLSAVEPGEYTLYCLPLKIQGSDGAPARAILVSE
ncbi:MAG: cyclase family protein [Anaerolineales bacterium]|nr:cyclase family protein [Chloroflexota bacterium]MBL6982344.1 cyclase family protein [Anaerolineales bacterium]